MRKVFVSYHHANDQQFKDALAGMNRWAGVFEDWSVNSGEIDDTFLSDEEIRVIVRDRYLRASEVTIVLVGTETRYRKHVDWELYSSMRDSALNPKSGIILVPLPTTGITHFTAAHGMEEKQTIYSDVTSWTSWNRAEHEEVYPHFSRRMIDNLVSSEALVSVMPWDRIISTPENLANAIEFAYADRTKCTYDFSTPMRRRNGPGPRR